jgi:hypothetical protein
VISFVGYIGPKNNQNKINRFQRGAECAFENIVIVLNIPCLAIGVARAASDKARSVNFPSLDFV